MLDAQAFEHCFCSWIKSLSLNINKEIISIDGKTLRRSHNRNHNQKALHLVSAWASNNRVMLGQVRTAEKSNEITAIPELLGMIDVEDSIVTIDAMGCQKNISKKIIAQKADYVLSLKQNQETLYKDVISIFEKAQTCQYKKILHRRKVEKVYDHGRVETRKYTLISARDPLMFELRWPGLKGIGKLEVTRTVAHQVEYSVRYFLTSLNYEAIDNFMEAVRKHWNIEINLHWSLDMSFREDESRIRIGNAAENLAIVRRIALNLLKQEKTNKTGISCKRKKAGWSNQYLMKVLYADAQLLNTKNQAV